MEQTGDETVTDAPHLKAKKEASLTMRLTRETKDALESVAREEGRSVSQVAERWLDAAAAGRANLEGRLGGGASAEALLAMADFAAAVAAEVGDPTKSLPARDALLTGWRQLLDRALPFTPNTADGVAAHLAMIDAKAQVDALLEAVLRAENNKATQAVREWLIGTRAKPVARGLISPADGSGRPLMLLLSQFSRHGLSADETAELIAMLNDAPPIPSDIRPLPAEVAAAIQTAHGQMARYMAPRHEAAAKGAAMAAAMGAPLPLM